MPAGWPTFEPVGDVVAALSLCVAFVLACLDCHLRHDRRPLPMVTTTAALAILWIADLIAFSGGVPGIRIPNGEVVGSWIFLTINVTESTLLAASLLHRSGYVNSCWVITSAMSAGLLVGAGMITAASLIATSPLGGGASDALSPMAEGVGASGRLSWPVGLCLVMAGLQGVVHG